MCLVLMKHVLPYLVVSKGSLLFYREIEEWMCVRGKVGGTVRRGRGN